MKNEIDMVLNARVKEVTKEKVIYTTKDADGKQTEHVIPAGFTLWSTGIGQY
jgi:NADH dehydrogenase